MRSWSSVLLLLAAGPWIGCGGPQPERAPAAAEVLFLGGEVLTLEKGRPRAGALAVSGGRILALGEAGAVAAAGRAGTLAVDLAGKVLLPAFVDPHVHLLNAGLALVNADSEPPPILDLAGASREEIAARVERWAAELPPGAWILGYGWSQGAWGDGALPTHHPLTAAAPDNPVFLARVDAHAGWVNAAALAAAGITASTPDPPGGAILRLAGGEPSGVLLERANELVVPRLPAPSDDEVRTAFRRAAAALAALGVVEVDDAGFLAPPGIVALNLDLGRYLELLRAADALDPLPLRLNLMVPAPSELAAAVLADPEAYRELSPRLRVTHLKLFADGAMGSRGAALSHPFADDPATAGVARMTAEELRATAAVALAAGLGVATHAIGDAAVARVLDAYEDLLAARPDLDPRRLRIEHFSYAAAADFERAARLGVVLSIQPSFVAPDDAGVAMEDRRVGAAAAERVYAWGTLARLGARLAAGSDLYTAPLPLPLLTFYSAVTRRNLAGRPAAGWHPGECLDRALALRLVTRRPAPAGPSPGQGTLAVGGPADLAILSADPLTAPAEDLLPIRVHATFAGGRVTYHDGSVAGLGGPVPAGEGAGRR